MGLVHLSTGNLNFAALKARANELGDYVRLHKDEREKIADMLKPAEDIEVVGSRASVVVLLSGEPVEWDEKGDRLAQALDIVSNWTIAEGVLLSEIRRAQLGLHGILIESSSRGADALKWHVQGSYAEQVLTARAQRAAVKGFVTKVATLFDKETETKADELVREFYRWRARSWWSDISTEATATALLQSYQKMLQLPEIVRQPSEEMPDYAAVTQEDAAKVAARSSNLFALTATIFTIIAVLATVGFTGAEVLGWHGGAGFLGALGVTAVGAGLISGALWGRLRRLRTDWRTGQSLD